MFVYNINKINKLCKFNNKQFNKIMIIYKNGYSLDKIFKMLMLLMIYNNYSNFYNKLMNISMVQIGNNCMILLI